MEKGRRLRARIWVTPIVKVGENEDQERMTVKDVKKLEITCFGSKESLPRREE